VSWHLRGGVEDSINETRQSTNAHCQEEEDDSWKVGRKKEKEEGELVNLPCCQNHYL
jgi:hypothetical protein